MADARVSRIITARKRHAGQRVHPGRVGRPWFWLVAGFCAHGIAGAGGIGRQVASWIVDGEPSSTSGRWTSAGSGGLSVARLHARRSLENYATYYDIHYPNEERQAGRPLRTSPTYDDLTALGAVFGEKSGWERPNWFEPNADEARFGGREALEALRPRGWAGQYWSPAIAAEALATRQAAALFDETSFAKLEVNGPGACAFLQRVAGNDIDRRRARSCIPSCSIGAAGSRPT